MDVDDADVDIDVDMDMDMDMDTSRRTLQHRDAKSLKAFHAVLSLSSHS